MSCAYVFSEPDDFVSRFGVTGRSSMPSASCRSQSARLPTVSRSRSGSAVRTSTSRSMPRARSLRAVTGPTPHSASTWSCCRNGSTWSGLMTVRPSGFFQPDAIFARNLFGATPADAVSRVSSRMRSFRRFAHACRQRLAPLVLGDVQVRLVERERLDERRHLAKQREHRVRRGLVPREVGRHDDERRTQPDGLRHRHGRAHAEDARLVARRRHHAAPVGLAADGDRPAGERGIVALLDRCVERVHVDVDDAAHEIADFRLQIQTSDSSDSDFRRPCWIALDTTQRDEFTWRLL